MLSRVQSWLKSTGQTWQHVRPTLRLVWAASRRGTLALVALVLLGTAFPLAVAYVGKAIVDAILLGASEQALRLVVLEAALMVGSSLTARGTALARQIVGARLGVDINVKILEKAQQLSLPHFEDPEVYDKLSKARREASSRPLSVVMGFLSLVQNALSLVGYLGLLVHVSGVAVVGLVLAAVPATLAEVRFSSANFRLRSFRAPETRRLAYYEFLLGNEGNAKEIMTFGLGPLFLSRYKELAETIYQEDKNLLVRRSIWGYVLSLLAVIAFYLFYAHVTLQTASKLLTLGSLTLYVVAFRQGQAAFQGILATLSGMFEDNLYMSNLFSFLVLDVRPSNKVTPAEATAKAEDPLGIVFENVGFRYQPASASEPSSDERWALRNISLHIAPGERLALVGENGSGKTTFIKLLTRLYEPTEGRILLDGRALSLWDEDSLRKRLGVIFQDFAKYHLSLAENVGLGSVEHLTDVDRIRRAIELGGASALASELPKGETTTLGRWFSREGTELSGGQWQKVALARAFMREGADILILDEPTSALDAQAEEAVFRKFQELSTGKTTILISHRFPTVRTADRIVVLAKGAIVEQGSHEELLAAKGRYQELFDLQAKGYM
jgi:ATP-binding cassette, subfamily B, bacterial